MRLLALSAAIAIATTVSLSVSATDIGYPPLAVGRDQYGVAPRPAVASPQVIIIPAPHQYNRAAIPPPGIGSSPYGVAPPVAPRVDVVPRGACPPVWRCGDRGCNWQPGCAPRPEHYSDGYGSPDPQVYPGPEIPPAPEPYSGPYAPQVYPGPHGSYSGDQSSIAETTPRWR
jgi:hypothetical protein